MLTRASILAIGSTPDNCWPRLKIPPQNQLDSATADYEGAKASAQVAALNVNRMQKLMPTGAIARTQLDSARADWLVASARLKSSEAALRNARESLGWTRPDSPGGRDHRRQRLCGSGCQRGQSVLTLATGEARDVVFDIRSRCD
jgi:multidrug efflux pump subunit AcrA (membrane-fusion protein)